MVDIEEDEEGSPVVRLWAYDVSISPGDDGLNELTVVSTDTTYVFKIDDDDLNKLLSSTKKN